MEAIHVTKTFLPPIADYQAYLEQIWASGQLTNQGPVLQQFETKAKEFLDVENFHFVSNGTTALQLALSALDISEGDIITTPFSYVATTSAILWEHCRPVFVDIEPDTFCIDAHKIEAAITENTKAILAVHVFGNPCALEKINAIAAKHKLKVIYDAAHAFGVKYKEKSLMSYGDITIGSFHATKLFHTIEGGCVIVKDQAVSEKVELKKRFGHNGDEHIMLGINAKSSEFQAAMGLCNLPYVPEIIAKRRQLVEQYNQLLKDIFVTPKIAVNTKHNYAYYPIIFDDERQLLRVKAALESGNIFPRRYFYPSLNTLPYIVDRQACPISEDIATRVLCLPLYNELSPESVDRICTIMKASQ